MTAATAAESDASVAPVVVPAPVTAEAADCVIPEICSGFEAATARTAASVTAETACKVVCELPDVDDPAATAPATAACTIVPACDGTAAAAADVTAASSATELFADPAADVLEPTLVATDCTAATMSAATVGSLATNAASATAAAEFAEPWP